MYWILYLPASTSLLDGRADRLLELGADRAARVLVQLEGLLGAALADDDGRAVRARGVGRRDDLLVLGRLPVAGLVGLHDGVADAAGDREDGDDGAADDDLPPDLVALGLALALRAQPLAGRATWSPGCCACSCWCSPWGRARGHGGTGASSVLCSAVSLRRRRAAERGGPRRPTECTSRRARAAATRGAGRGGAAYAPRADRTVTAATASSSGRKVDGGQPRAAAGPAPRSPRRSQAAASSPTADVRGRAAARRSAGPAWASSGGRPVGRRRRPPGPAGCPRRRRRTARRSRRSAAGPRPGRPPGRNRACWPVVKTVSAASSSGISRAGDPAEAALAAGQRVRDDEDGGGDHGHGGQRQRDPGQQHVGRGCRASRRAP